MKTKTLQEALPTIGAKQSRVEGWLAGRIGRVDGKEVELSSELEETVPGRTRRFTKDNVLELASLAGFVAAGLDVRVAAAFAERVVSNRRTRGYTIEWMIFRGDQNIGISEDAISPAVVAKHLAKASPPTLKLVNMGEIVRRVDKLFSEAD